MLDPVQDPGAAGRAARNAAWLLSSQLVTKVASVVFVIVVARALGVEEYGWFTFATAFVPLLLSFGTLGLDTVVVREIALRPSEASSVFASGLVLRLVTAVGSFAVALALAPVLLEETQGVLTVALVGTALLVDEATGYVSTMFRAFEQMRYYGTALVVNRLVGTGLTVVAYLAGGGLVAITLMYLLGSVAALVYSWASMHRHLPRVRVRSATRAEARVLLRQGLPIGVAGVLNMALFRLDTVMVQAFEGARAVGLYGVAFRFFETLLFVSWSIAGTTLPGLSRAGTGPRAARMVEGGTAAALAFYLPVLAGALFSAPWVVTTVFGARYASAADAVPWLLAAAALYAVTFQARTSALALERGRAIGWIACAALVVNVLANLVLIPAMGFAGAAIGTAIASALEAALTVGLVRRAGVPVRAGRSVAVPVLATGVMLAGLLLSGATGPAAVAVGAVVYPLALVATARVLLPTESRRLAQRLVDRIRT